MTSGSGAQVDPQAILDLWFPGSCSTDAEAANALEDFWFGTSAATDALLRERFAAAIEVAGCGELASWLSDPRSNLALVLLLDQFPRNVFRGTARAFAYDDRAREAARAIVDRDHLWRLTPIQQAFAILPFEHSESLGDQDEAVRLSAAILAAAPPAWHALLRNYAGFAHGHRDVIARFGRFPHRNRVLGRADTAAEAAYLRDAATFGQ